MSTRAIQIGFLLAGITDDTGTILAGGSVYFYAAGTDNAKNVWTEKEKTNAYVYRTLDSSGATHVYGDGIYKILAYDSAGALKRTWDNIKIRATNYAVVSKVAAYTTTADDDVVLVNTTSGAVTITILPAASMEYPVTVIHTAGTNAITLEPNGSETIDGASNYSFTSIGTAVIVVSDGSNLKKAGHVALGLADGATITLANEGLHLLDSNASHDLIVKPGSNLTADRILTITTGDAARTFALNENLTIGDGYDVTITAVGAARAISLSGNLTISDAVTLKAADIFPAATCMLFGQNSAPTGWTRKGDWQDNAMLCYAASGDIGSGGSVNPQSTHTHGVGTYQTPAHVHQWYNYIDAGTCSQIYNSGGTATNVSKAAVTTNHIAITAGGDGLNVDAYTKSEAAASITGASAANTAPHYQEVIAATKD